MPYLIIFYIFLFIFRPTEVWPQLGELHIERIYVLVMFGVFLFHSKNRNIAHPLHYYLILLLVLVVFARVYSPYPSATVWQSEEYIKLVLFYFILLYGITSRDDLEKVIFGFIIVMFIYEAKSLWEFFIHGRHVYRMGIVRLVGIDSAHSDPNTYSASIVYILPFVVMFLRYQNSLISRKLVVSLCLTLLGISLVSLIFTGSRSGQVSALLFFLLLWIQSRRKFTLAVTICVFLTLVWAYMPIQYQTRFISIWNPEVANISAAESAQGRLDGLKDGLELFKLRPVFGFGAGAFRRARALVGPHEGLASHNLYAQTLGDLGLAGTLLMIFISMAIWRHSKRLQQVTRPPTDTTPDFYYLLATAINQTLILLLFQGNFGHNLYRYTWLWISAFLMLAIFFRDKVEMSTNNTNSSPPNQISRDH